MPTRDNFSNQIVTEALEETTVFTASVTKGTIIDTADYDMGIMFALSVFIGSDRTLVLSFEEGDDPALADAVVVGPENIIGDTNGVVAEEFIATDPWPGNGLSGTKRYVRAVVSASGVGGGETAFYVVAVLSGEYNFQDQ